MRASLKNIFTVERLAATVVVGLSLLLPLCATAQQQEEPQAQQPATPQQPARKLNLMQRLNLSPEQRQQLREIRTQSDAEMRAHTRRVRLARRALDEAIYADSVDEELIAQRSRELSQAQSALTLLRASTELKIRRVLTSEQLQLFRTLRQQAQRQLMLQRRMNRALRPSATPSPSEPDDTQPKPPASNTPAARRRRP
ncbi:MAG: Spy/CpxP family protein refolding chaperone [Pyrinomonadaceae bacterium]